MTDKPPTEQQLLQAERTIDWLALQPFMEAVNAKVRSNLRVPVYKMLLLQRWYGLSDIDLESACQDRISFRRFLGVPLEGDVAEATVLDAFRSGLSSANAELHQFFMAVEAQLAGRGLTMPGRPGGTAASDAQAPATGPQGVTETVFFEAGELRNLVAAATQASGRIAGPVTLDRIAKSSAAPAPGADAPPAAGTEPGVDIHWPWGMVTRLNGTIRIGREFGYSPFARELQNQRHVSRRHVEITQVADSVWVRDLGSSNGTYIDGEQVPKGQACLVDSDAAVRLGPTFTLALKFR